jgi:hypothetical protein
MRLHDILTEEQLDEINWKKGLATAATAGALAVGGASGAKAQSYPYQGSPIQQQLQQVDKKLDQKIAQQKQANKAGSLAAGAAISSALGDLGGALQNSRFKSVADEIAASGQPWKIFKNKFPLGAGGTITIIAGGGKAAMITDTSHLGMAGTVVTNVFDKEISPGVYLHSFGLGKTKLDTNTEIIQQRGIGGDRDPIKLKLTDSGEGESTTSQTAEPPQQQAQQLDPNEKKAIMQMIGKSVRSQISIQAPSEPYDKETLIRVFFDKEGNATKAAIKGTTGIRDLDMEILSKVQELKNVSGIDELQKNIPSGKLVSITFQTKHLVK